MSWFFEVRERESEKNGRIIAKRLMGEWWVTVDGCGETTPGLHAMWEEALRKVRLHTGLPPVTRVLMLGLGAGGEIKTVRRFFPNAALTVIEYDEEMVKLAKELQLYWPHPFPRVICEDAGTALPRLKEKFDLIIVDMFKGATASPLSKDPDFQKALNDRLNHGGLLVANVYKHEHLLDELARGLYRVRKWRYNTNHLGLFGKREVKECLEEGYRPVREWPDFDPMPFMKELHPARVGERVEGVYWRFGPFSFEKYLGDSEPDIRPLPKELQRPFRIIMWQRLSESIRPPKWIAFTDGPSHTFPVLRVHPEYFKDWDESARRSRRKWQSALSSSRYSIETVSYDEFIKAYQKSTLPFGIKQSMPGDIKVRIRNPKTPVSFLAVRRKKDGKIVAGMARMKSTTLPIWFYVAGFYLREVRQDPVMIGLLGRWYEEAMDAGVRFIDLGYVWRYGRDGSWKGLSTFKSKFNPAYFFYPAILYRFEWGLQGQNSKT